MHSLYSYRPKQETAAGQNSFSIERREGKETAVGGGLYHLEEGKECNSTGGIKFAQGSSSGHGLRLLAGVFWKIHLKSAAVVGKLLNALLSATAKSEQQQQQRLNSSSSEGSAATAAKLE